MTITDFGLIICLIVSIINTVMIGYIFWKMDQMDFKIAASKYDIQ